VVNRNLFIVHAMNKPARRTQIRLWKWRAQAHYCFTVTRLKHLATVLAILNLLAFACHIVCEPGDWAWQAARRELVTRQGFFQSPRTITTYLLFQSRDDLLGILAFTRPPPLGP
jgi:hypothetical protein